LSCCTQNLRNSDLLVLLRKDKGAAQKVVKEETANVKAASPPRFKRLVGGCSGQTFWHQENRQLTLASTAFKVGYARRGGRQKEVHIC